MKTLPCDDNCYSADKLAKVLRRASFFGPLERKKENRPERRHEEEEERHTILVQNFHQPRGLERWTLAIIAHPTIRANSMQNYAFYSFRTTKSLFFLNLKVTYLDNLVCRQSRFVGQNRHHRRFLACFSDAVARKLIFLHSVQECSLFSSIHLYSKFPTVVTLRYRQPNYSPYIRVAL